MFRVVTLFSIFMLAQNMNAQEAPVQRKDLMQMVIHQNLSKVEMQEITFAPGIGAPRHLHPCPVIGWIKSGEILFQIEGQEAVILKEGDTFYEPKDEKILHFDNVSKTASATFIAVYLKEGEENNIAIIE